ncbi:hypothetical protein LSAT2_014676 [Lamellibrachia satsuma]|nr:hypothetical protein LSAT2_014676 [Lamellibrachia satsuma]
MTTLPLLAVAICTAVLVSSEGALKVRNGRTLCVYEKKTYRPGQRFKPNACTSCRCPKHGGRVRCSIKDCRYEPNCLQFDTSPKCCPACLRYGCLHSDGKVYEPDTVVSVDQCGKCVCPSTGGRTICTMVPCPRLHCVDAVADPGQCCKKCVNGANCWLKKEIIPAEKMVRVGHCKICQCPQTPLPHWMSPKRRRAVCTTLDDCS